MGISNVDAEAIQSKAKEADNVPVRIALFGQPGAGKSSLINAIIGEDKARVAASTDTTQELESHEWNGLVLCDLPGYGTTKFPVGTYFEKFKVLSFDVFLCVSAGKFLDADTKFYKELLLEKKPCIFVRNKADAIFQKGLSVEQLKQQVTVDLYNLIDGKPTLLFTSCQTNEGLSELIESISERLAGVKRDRFLRAAKAYSKDFLDQKKKACQRYANLAAGAAAAVNLVPVPGLGLAADLGAVVALLAAVRKDFGLDIDKLSAFENFAPALAGPVQDIIKSLSKEGALWMMKRYAGNIAVSQASQFIPFVGQAIAASLSFLTIQLVASRYIDNCYTVAEGMLTEHFGY